MSYMDMVDVDVQHKKKKENEYERRLEAQRKLIMKDAEKNCNRKIDNIKKQLVKNWDAAMLKMRTRDTENKKKFESNIARCTAVYKENEQLKKRIAGLKILEEKNKIITEGNRKRYVERYRTIERLTQEIATLREEIATRDAAESLAGMGKRRRINFTNLNL